MISPIRGNEMSKIFRLVVSEPPPLAPSTPEVVVAVAGGAPDGSPEPDVPCGSEDGVVAAPGWKGKEREQVVTPSSDSAIVLPDNMTDDEHNDEDDDEDGSGSDNGDDDWTQYEPPEELKAAPGVESEIILRVLQDSIERIKARIAEDETRRRAEAEAEAARTREEEEEEEGSTQREDDKGKQPASADGPARPPSPDRNPYAYAMSKKTLRMGPHGLLPTAAPKPKKRSLFSLLRRLNGHGEKGETSAAGASRHTHSGSTGSFDFAGRGRGRAALDAFKKAASGAGSSKSSMEEDVEV